MPTYKEYASFCEKIREIGVPTYTVEQACGDCSKRNNAFMLIKHDVEDKPEKALAIGKIEKRFGIQATYYVHSFFLKNPKHVSILKQMQKLGHEIGYHYDVLDNNDGDKLKSTQEFKEALECFNNNGFKIKTLCPHGNPLKKRVGYSSNKDFFLDENIRKQFSDIEDVYITFPDLVENDYLYITDAKYAYSYRDAKSTRTDATEEFHPLEGEDEIISRLKDKQSMILSTHSHRYVRYKFMILMRMGLYKFSKIVASILFKTRWGKRFINKFYYLAKKI